MMHEAQREEIGLRWAAARVDALRRGVCVSWTPTGYAKDPDTGRLTPNEHAPAVAAAFALRADGGSWHAVAKLLTEAGAPPRRGDVWSAKVVGKLLSNPVYTGRIDESQEEPHEAVVGPGAVRQGAAHPREASARRGFAGQGARPALTPSPVRGLRAANVAGHRDVPLRRARPVLPLCRRQ